ncbi:hypothetical protein INS49_009802 [Diaporthe citri]|uniref:uncharacterized protein n=1 Tax=Diaporthe citri TaxID=83186 RepID=UPI001C80DE56|nr:uncharacterized protein INS49_009802 [Diaporthe citri]KAG6361575.1 hypothetical protein INS49_009802 [Diaporthe citri]
MRLQLPWKRKKVAEIIDASPGVDEAGSEGKAPRGTTFDTLVAPSEVDTLRSDTQLSTRRTTTSPKERWGLFVLEPQDDNDPDAIDIVALHGLNGHWEKTWQSDKSTSKGGGAMWLRDFLPQQIPHARIMSFGYDSVLLLSKSTSDVGTFAEQLLESLLSRRVNVPETRPIIFICHSLGGIVVKKAIIRAHERDRYHDLLQSVHGIMFFGTPHRGSSLANWSTVLGNVASYASLGSKTNWKLSQHLQTESGQLQEISKSFVDRAKTLQIISFYETDKMDFLNQRVVDEDSAVLGFPDEVTIGITGNHRTMCRFDSIDEQRYRCVWTNIQNLAGSASNPKQVTMGVLDRTSSGNGGKVPLRGLSQRSSSRKLNEPWPTDVEQQWKLDHLGEDFGRANHDDVAESINQTEIKRQQRLEAARQKEERKAQMNFLRLLHNSNYEAHKDRYPPAVPGTCQWLIRHEKYRNWRQKQGSDLLWLSADAGCGKSVLTSYLIDHLKSSENKIQVPEIVCYFFFKEDNSEQNDATHAISAILHQLYTAQPWLLRHVTNQFLDQGKDILRSFNSLWKLLDISTTEPSSRDVILVFDGLDECEPSTRHQLLQSLTRFYSAREGSSLTDPPFVKTIIASRPGNDIKHAFDVLPTIRLRGEDEPEAISQDVELVIEHHIENATRRGIPREVLADVRAGLIKGADRTFLWTTLVIGLLETKKGASMRELISILDARGDIFQIYERMLDHSSDASQAWKLLQIVVGAIRPMTLSELSVAMAVSTNQTTFEDLKLDVVHNFEERAKELCGHFVRIWHKSIVLKHAHHEVLDICLHYLSLLNVKSSRRLSIAENLFSDQFAGRFLEYAGRYWTVHYHCVAPDLTPSQLDMCARLCNSNTQGFGEWFHRASELAQNPGHNLREGVTQRDIAHLFGLEEVVQLLDRMLKPEDVQDPALRRYGESSTQKEDGSITIPNSPRLLAVEEVVHPHTISPGHLLESPLSEAVDTGFHLFRHVITPIADAGYTVIAPDYRGAGHSSKPRDGYEKTLMAADIHKLLTEHLGITEPVHVVGHDIGGMVAHAYASRFSKDTASVAHGEFPMPGTKVYDNFCRDHPGVWHFHFHWQTDLPELLTQGRERQHIKHFYDRLCINSSAISPSDVDYYASMFEKVGATRAGFDVYRAFHKDAEENQDWVANNGKCAVPCMSLNGDGSFMASTAADQNLEVYEATETATIPGSGHWRAEENPSAFTQTILAWAGKKDKS